MTTVTNSELKTIITTNATTTNSNFQKAKQAIAGKVDKVTGKGLSTNDFTDALQTKLNGIEANADVSLVQGVQVNGTDLTPDANKKVNVVIPAAAVYTIGETTTSTGMLKTYGLFKDNTLVTGSIIDIPKDFLVKSASMGVCETDDTPLAGLEVGDPYLDFVINTKDNATSTGDQHIYINVKGLVDIYTAGDNIDITDNEVSVVLTGYEKASAASAIAATDSLNDALGKLEYKADAAVVANSAITGATKCKITYDSKGLVTAGADLAATDIPALDSAKITTMGSYEKASASAAIATTDSLDDAIGKLEYKADNAVVKNSAITGATKCKITYDAKGLVTAGADLEATDIPSLSLAKISDVTATAAEVNVLDGITASTAELNILDGVTADKDEINVLDGITATTTELNYVDGVTSAIQDQLDAKATPQDVTDTINTIFGEVSITAWDDIVIS